MLALGYMEGGTLKQALLEPDGRERMRWGNRCGGGPAGGLHAAAAPLSCYFRSKGSLDAPTLA